MMDPIKKKVEPPKSKTSTPLPNPYLGPDESTGFIHKQQERLGSGKNKDADKTKQ